MKKFVFLFLFILTPVTAQAQLITAFGDPTHSGETITPGVILATGVIRTDDHFEGRLVGTATGFNNVAASSVAFANAETLGAIAGVCIATATLTTRGSCVLIFGQFTVKTNSSSGNSIFAGALRDGVNFPASSSAAVQRAPSATNDTNWFPLAFNEIDCPSAGPHSYCLVAYKEQVGAAVVTTGSGKIGAIEIR